MRKLFFSAMFSMAAFGLHSAPYFDQPVNRYGHHVLGDTPEWGALCNETGCISLPKTRIFEDIAPRMADLDGDGAPEIIVVESAFGAGAALVIYDQNLEKIAQTPPIGTQNRWLAPIGAVDIDGDGFVEIAYVEKPHLTKLMRVWRFDEGQLIEIAKFSGVSNHRIGENFITSAVRDCPDARAFLTPSADRSRLIGVVYDGAKGLIARDLGAFSTAALEAAARCD